MIRFVEHADIDKRRWDACIERSSNGMIYARSWYLDIVSPGWNALTDGDYKSVFPLTWKKKYGIQYLHQPFFTQQLGVFSEEKKEQEKITSDFLSAIPEKYRFIEIQLNSANGCSQKDFKISERITHHLDLDQSYEKICKSYSENLKRNIKRAEKNEIEISKDVDAFELVKLFRNNKGKDVDNLNTKDYIVLQQLVAEAGKKKLISMFAAKTAKEKTCAGAIFLESDHEYIFFFSAANAEARETGAMSALIDHFIRLHSDGKKKLDFEGSMDKNLARFYKSFGSKEIVYLQIRKNRLPAYVKWIKK